MLIECQKRGICGKVTNMYDLYFADTKNDATIVPYMEGDYFPAEVENIIKELEEGKGGKKAKEAGKKKKAKKAKSPVIEAELAPLATTRKPSRPVASSQRVRTKRVWKRAEETSLWPSSARRSIQ